MKNMKKPICLILLLGSFSFLFAQTNDPVPPPLTAPWEVVEVNQFPGPIPYPAVKQIDVMWSMYVWRELDLREKRNHALYFPTEPQGNFRNLAQVILDAIDLNNLDNEDALPIYTDEKCNVRVPRADIKNALGNTRKITMYDPDTGEPTGQKDIDEPFTAADVMYYHFKEVWFFDKNRGELGVRILSIAPYFEYEKPMEGINDDDVVSPKVKRRLGYIKYDELRPFLAQQLYFTPRNTALRVTFDDILTWKRYFASYIIAASNEHDRDIQDYIKNPRDQRLESERILNQIRTFESELWEY